MSETQRAILLSLKAAIDAALALAVLSDAARRALTAAQRALARELWPS